MSSGVLEHIQVPPWTAGTAIDEISRKGKSIRVSRSSVVAGDGDGSEGQLQITSRSLFRETEML